MSVAYWLATGPTVTWAHAGALAQAVAAVAAVIVAGLVAVMPYARRPKLSLVEDQDRVHSHVEVTPQGRMPFLRVLAANSSYRRAARETRVLIEGYRRLSDPGSELTTLGHPSLGWPSAPEADATASVIVFSGGIRPLGLGRLIRVRLDGDGRMRRPNINIGNGQIIPGVPHYGTEMGDMGDPPVTGWYLWLDLAFAQDISDNRDKLPPVDGGYAIRLLIGAEDGAARIFEVHIDWDGSPDLDAEEVLSSALDHLAVLTT